MSVVWRRVGLREFWIKFDGVTVIGVGSVQIALGLFGKTAVVVGSGVFRIEINGAIEVCDGFIQIALVLFGKAAVVVG